MSEIIMQAFRGQSEHSDSTQCSEHSESIKRALREHSEGNQKALREHSESKAVSYCRSLKYFVLFNFLSQVVGNRVPSGDSGLDQTTKKSKVGQLVLKIKEV